ncbi:MAG: hypothetical protein ACLTQN_11245 [Blautia massiliensis (ex Durand et al. 2017)]
MKIIITKTARFRSTTTVSSDTQKTRDGHLIIGPTEAEVVKRIYREYLEGGSLLQIGRGA